MTGHHAVGDWSQHGVFGAASLDDAEPLGFARRHERAPWMEPASGRDVGSIGCFASEDLLFHGT
jgi:hypothetical protein